MKRRIKIVKSRSGKLMYYVGDGLWFNRIAESKALTGLASKEYTLGDRCVPHPTRG